MIWAERDYTAWHRICNGCGSHWSVTPEGLVEDRQCILIERAKFVQEPQENRG